MSNFYILNPTNPSHRVNVQLVNLDKNRDWAVLSLKIQMIYLLIEITLSWKAVVKSKLVQKSCYADIHPLNLGIKFAKKQGKLLQRKLSML